MLLGDRLNALGTPVKCSLSIAKRKRIDFRSNVPCTRRLEDLQDSASGSSAQQKD